MLQYACSALSTRADFFAYDCSCTLDASDPTESALVTTLIDQASDMLCLLSGGRTFGRCTKTVRPLAYGTGCYGGGGWPNYGGAWPGYGPIYNTPYASEFDGLDVIPLRGPMTDIAEVRIDGVVLASSAYRLVNDRYLLRVDGSQWPGANDLRKALTEVGTWGITYRFGRGPDRITSDAVNELVCELAKTAAERKSNLPLGVTTVNLQGVSATLEDMADALKEGHENLPAVSRFLGIINPSNLRDVNGVWSPEMTRGWELYEVEGPSGS